MILVTLAGSSFSWEFSSRRMVPVSFSISTQEAQERFRPLSARAAPEGGTAAARARAANRRDTYFFIGGSSRIHMQECLGMVRMWRERDFYSAWRIGIFCWERGGEGDSFEYRRRRGRKRAKRKG